MKKLSVRLSEELAAQIEAESRERRMSKSDIICERLNLARPRKRRIASFASIRDLIGSVDGLPADLTTRKKKYLRST
jgi:hypothetical protein